MARGIADIYFNPGRGGTSYRTGYVDRPRQIMSDKQRPNYLSTPRFVDGRIIGPDRTRALGSSMSGPDALSRSGINSLPSAGSTQGISRMQSMGNALGTMFGRAAADPRNPLNSLQQAKRRVPPRANITTSQVPANRGSISSLVDKGVSNMRTNQGSALREPDAMPMVAPTAQTMNANANSDRATMQGARTVDLDRVSSEVKQGSANLGNQIMGMVSDTYASVMGKMPSSEEVRAITKKAIDKFKSVDTRLKQSSADITKLAVAAVRSAVSDAQAGTVGESYFENDMPPQQRKRGGISNLVEQAASQVGTSQQQPQAQARGIGSLERRAMGPGMQSPTQRPPRVFMEDGSEMGSGQGRLPQPVKAVPTTAAGAKADAGMMTGPEGAVPDSMATPLPDAVMDPTDSELNAGMDQELDNRAPAEKTENDFANMTLVELGLNMMASDKPTVLGMFGDAAQKTLAAKTVREEKAADRKLKQDMAQLERDFRMGEGDKNRKLEKEKIDNIYEARMAEVRFQSDKLNIDEKLINARITGLRAESRVADKMLDLKERELTSKDIRADQSLFQTVWKTTSDLVIAANKSNYNLNRMEPSKAAEKLTSLVEDRLLATVGSSAAGRAFSSPAFKEFIKQESLKKYRKSGSGADFTFTKERGFQPTKAD